MRAGYGQLKTQNANLEAARTRVEQATVTATLESTQAQRAITVAEQAKSVSEKSRDLARETARLSQVAFESGAGTSLAFGALFHAVSAFCNAGFGLRPDNLMPTVPRQRPIFG